MSEGKQTAQKRKSRGPPKKTKQGPRAKKSALSETAAPKKRKMKRNKSEPAVPTTPAPLPSMDAEDYARARKIQSVHERMARLGWVLQHRVCEYLESIDG